MLPAWFIFVAVALRFCGGLIYAWAVIKKRAKPNPISWFFWALTPMIVFAAQLSEHVGWSVLVTFVLGFSPFIVFLLSLIYSFDRSHFTFATLACAVLAGIGVVLWLTTNDPILAIVFSIFADICGSIPTVLKAYHNPHSEVALPYLLSILSMTITLFALTDWRLPSYAYPVYIFGINLVIFSLVFVRSRAHTQRRRKNALMR